jgi:two-component system NtrC family sensor kinase
MREPLTAQNSNTYNDDTAKVRKLIETAQRLRFFKPDSSVVYADKALQLSQLVGFKKGIIAAHNTLGEYHRVSGNYPKSLENLFVALQISSEIGDSIQATEALGFIGITYLNLKEQRTALNYLFQAYAKKDILDTPMIGFILANTIIAYRELNMLDSALVYQKMAWSIAQNSKMLPGKAFVLREMGNVYSELNLPDSAFYYYRYALGITPDVLNIGRTYGRMANLFYKLEQYDSVLFYANQALFLGRRSSQKPIMLEASKTLTAYYIQKNKLDSALKYQQLTMSINDSLFGSEQLRKIQLLAISEQKKVYIAEQRQLQIEQEQTQYRNRIRTFILLAILATALLVGIILYRNNRKKQVANRLLEKQKIEIERTLKELRAAQAQLIQSEKMASLGELTAGIAHEIQNPLNFVNNFSEVNEELIRELITEADKGNLEEVKGIVKDIGFNSQKINLHGKRAAAIVKGMLQHSRSSSGIKEPTDINALADEYLRLSYHGLRAKDKSFNATIKTEFDDSIGRINIIPQDMGRVILNLINNAFYAVDEKKKKNKDGYDPVVSVSTKKDNNKVEIKVSDNGNGIPPKVIDKIFQPFFTTKPTGQGTGLGLSLSYDIVKTHGGELRVKTFENEGSEFVIVLPI